MRRERFEEILLVAIGIGMLGYLLPASFLQKLLGTLVISAALVAILLLRSIDWRTARGSPFDVILLAGVTLTLVHMATFYAFAMTFLSNVVAICFAGFYCALAVILAQHRTGWLRA